RVGGGPQDPRHHRRRRRRRPPAGHGRGPHDAAGPRCTGGKPRAEGAGLAALDRADAGRGAGRHARDREGRGHQRRAAGGGHPRDERSGAARAPATVPRRTDRPRAQRLASMKPAPILPGAALGVLGSGQLGRMFAMAARRLGYRVHVFSPDTNTPAGQVADVEIAAPHDYLDAVRAFARSVDVVTFEFEKVPAATAEAVVEIVPMRPNGAVLHVAQQRAREKGFLAEKGFPVTPFVRVTAEDELDAALARTGVPAVMKTASLGYDGKGQAKVADAAAAREAWRRMGGVEVVVERFIPFEREVSVVAARGLDGWTTSYGVIEN